MSVDLRYRLIDQFRGTHTVRQYQWLINSHHTSGSLRELQKNRFIDFLTTLRKSNPYYSKALGDVDESRIQADPENVLQTLPIVDKPFIKQNIEQLFAPLVNRKYQTKRTGGSTGRPLPYYIDLASVSESWAYILWCWHQYTGYRPGMPYLVVAGDSLGALGHNLKIRLYHFLQNNYFIDGSMLSENTAINLNRVRNAFLLYGYPSSIFFLLKKRAVLFERHSLKAVFTTSEQLTENARKFIEDRLGIPVYDMYGANDGGIISCECEKHAGYHYDPLNCYVETYQNEDGQDELLLTGLTSCSLPFVRYRVGDAASLGDFGSCSCGNPFPMILNLKGRTRDIVKLQSGAAVHGSMFNKLFFKFPEIQRYRIIQHEDYTVSFHLEISDYSQWSESDRKSSLESNIRELLSESSFEIRELKQISAGNEKFQLIESHVS